MAKTKEQPKFRIICPDGRAENCKIITPGGEELKNVTGISITISPYHGVEATIELVDRDIDTVAKTDVHREVIRTIKLRKAATTSTPKRRGKDNG